MITDWPTLLLAMALLADLALWIWSLLYPLDVAS